MSTIILLIFTLFIIVSTSYVAFMIGNILGKLETLKIQEVEFDEEER